MKMSTRATAAWRYLVRIVVLYSLAVAPSRCFPSENEHRSRGQDSPAVAADWREVAPSARLAILQMIEQQTKGNYERISTWQGAYRVQAEQHLPKETVQANIAPMARTDRAQQEGALASALVQRFNCVQLFAIDISTGSVYRARDTLNLKWMEEGKERKIPRAVPIEERSIVTSEDYVHFPPKVVWPEFEAVAGFRKAQHKHAAFRDPPEKAANKHFGDLMDPRCFFGLDSGAKFWEDLSLITQALQEGRAGTLTIDEAVDSRRPYYRVVRELRGPGGASKRYLTSI